MFVGLLSMLQSASKELGIENLTKSDEQVLCVLWELAHDDNVKVNYEKFLAVSEELDFKISRAQFYKSIRLFEKKNIITKIGSERSHTYKIAAI